MNGYGIINAAKGETPEVFILEIQGGGKKLYALTDIVERKDVAARLSNASLNFSGFTGFIPPKAISKPFTVSMLQGFRNKFFPCKNTLVVK